jgi:hypothetical protein
MKPRKPKLPPAKNRKHFALFDSDGKLFLGDYPSEKDAVADSVGPRFHRGISVFKVSYEHVATYDAEPEKTGYRLVKRK